jgi:hypothetical protein
VPQDEEQLMTKKCRFTGISSGAATGRGLLAMQNVKRSSSRSSSERMLDDTGPLPGDVLTG